MKEKKITIWENHKQVAMFYASTKKEVFEKIKSLGLLGKGAILVQNNRKEEV